MAEAREILCCHSKLSFVFGIFARVSRSKGIKRDSILDYPGPQNIEKARLLVELASMLSTQIALKSGQLVGQSSNFS